MDAKDSELQVLARHGQNDCVMAVGRRAWLLQGNGVGATASANWLSLIATARANGLEPYAYLVHVIAELPKATKLTELEALLPWNVRLAASANAG